jgi:hypothetical protein
MVQADVAAGAPVIGDTTANLIFWPKVMAGPQIKNAKATINSIIT